MLAVGVASALAGCGPSEPMAPVEGVATIDDAPLGNVLLTFFAVDSQYATRSMGVTDDAGRFKLRAETQIDGAIVGEHRVTVEDLAIYDAPRAEDGTVLQMPATRFPAIYSDPLRTPLTATVSSDAPPISLKLFSKQATLAAPQ